MEDLSHCNDCNATGYKDCPVVHCTCELGILYSKIDTILAQVPEKKYDTKDSIREDYWDLRDQLMAIRVHAATINKIYQLDEVFGDAPEAQGN